jgi:hypothetical protein
MYHDGGHLIQQSRYSLAMTNRCFITHVHPLILPSLLFMLLRVEHVHIDDDNNNEEEVDEDAEVGTDGYKSDGVARQLSARVPRRS